MNERNLPQAPPPTVTEVTFTIGHKKFADVPAPSDVDGTKTYWDNYRSTIRARVKEMDPKGIEKVDSNRLAKVGSEQLAFFREAIDDFPTDENLRVKAEQDEIDRLEFERIERLRALSEKRREAREKFWLYRLWRAVCRKS